MLFPTYLGRVWTFAFRRFALRTDAMQVVAASAIPLLAPYLGIKNPTQVSSEVLAYIGMAALALIAIRILSAPYFIWKEDQNLIEEQREELEAPDRREIEAGLEHRILLRRELVEKMAKLVAMAGLAQAPKGLEAAYRHRETEMVETTTRISEIVSAMAYDVPLRVCSLNLQTLCLNIMSKASKGEPIDKDIERLWAQRKLTFRLLQRDDEVNDFMTMLEIENLIEQFGETFDPDRKTDGPIDPEVDPIRYLKNAVRGQVKELEALGAGLHLLGRQPNFSSANRREALKKKDGGKLPTR